MNIVSLRIKNFMSISDVEIKPGHINQVTGANNQGKTTILKALGFAAKGSTDHNLVKRGEDQAEVLVELSDGTSIRRRINSEGRQNLEVKRDGAKFTAGQAMLDVLFDSSFFNPMEVLDPKARNEAILKAIDIKVTKERLAELLKEHRTPGAPPVEPPEGISYDVHGLKVIKMAHDYFFSRRAEANKAVATAKNRLDTYKADLTALPQEPELNRASLLVKRNELDLRISEEQDKIREINNMHAQAQAARNRVTTYVNEANKIDAEIQELEKKLQAARARRESAEEFIKKAEADVPKNLPVAALHEQNIAALKEEVGKVQLTVKEWDRIEEIQKQHSRVGEIEAEYQRAKVFADGLTAVVDGLRGPIKKKLMDAAEMPVKGLEFNDGTFTVDGIAVDNLSSSAALRLAVAVARKLAKNTKIICIDGAELLDDATWAAFCDETKGDGFTYFVTKVGSPRPADGAQITMQNGEVLQ